MKFLLIVLLAVASFFAYQEQKNATALQTELDATKQQLDDTQSKLAAEQDELARLRQASAGRQAITNPLSQPSSSAGQPAPTAASQSSGSWMWQPTEMDAATSKSKAKRH